MMFTMFAERTWVRVLLPASGTLTGIRFLYDMKQSRDDTCDSRLTISREKSSMTYRVNMSPLVLCTVTGVAESFGASWSRASVRPLP